MTVKIEKYETDKIAVHSPYNTKFVTLARRLGGKFEKGAWVFDAREEEAVRAGCMKIYGEDGSGLTNFLTVKLTFVTEDYAVRKAYAFCGRSLARAYDRDSGAKIEEGVIVHAGNVKSGGSWANFQTIIEAGTVLEVRDMSRTLVEAFIKKQSEESKKELIVEIISDKKETSKESLEAEKEKLLARKAELEERIAEIEELLK